MKRSLPLILLFTVSLCGSKRQACQIFNSSEKSLQQYCDGFQGILPGNCSIETDLKNIQPQVHKLKIRGCESNIVLNSVQQFQQSLRVLDISYSGFESLDWFDLTIDQLQIFNASHNKLSDLLGNPFRKFPKVAEIDLSYNRLQSVNDEDDEELPNLRRLHLSHNNFTHYADMENFHVQSIDYIDLSNNRIAFLTGIPHRQYKSLKELHLEENPVREVDTDLLEAIFDGQLNSLFLTWKNVMSFLVLHMDEIHVEQVRIVRTNETNSEGMFRTPNGTYEIRCIDKCFENVYYFEAVHGLFQNGNDVIQNIGPKVIRIILSGNFIGELNPSAFDRFTELNTLRLSATNLTWFDFNMLQNQKDIINYVDISKNNLKELRNIPSVRSYKLQGLIMGGNQIENAYEIIENLDSSIEVLDLSGGNNVGKLNDTTFQNLIELKRLNLSNTNLGLPYSNPFEMLQKLEVLDLSHNNLGNFDFLILATPLHNLTELYLVDCRIKDIDSIGIIVHYFGPNLFKLDLSDNARHGAMDSSNFDLNSMRYQRKLRYLDISNNDLITVDFKSYDDYININLEGNRFPCVYIKQLKNDYLDKITLAEGSWKQKPDRDCRTSAESIKEFTESLYATIKFW